ncbi:MAG: hypothetical protein U0R26_02010 [Solirubrobacterales bacterium]
MAAASLGLALTLALGGPAGAATDDANVAACRLVFIGHGTAGWRSESAVAGPVGVRRHPLSTMSRTRNGQLLAKMPLLVEGHAPVTVSVPPRLRNRVFLYYGRILDREGHPTTSFNGARGYAETVFKPCEDRPRTIWPGGIRVKGRGPVHLLVAVAGRTGSIPLHLGRPRVHRPS